MAPLVDTDGPDVIPGAYIVVLAGKPGSTEGLAARDASIARAKAFGGQVTYMYNAALNGYAAKLSPDALAMVRRDPGVSYVGADGWAHTNIDRPIGNGPPKDTGGNWGLDRIDQRDLPWDGIYSFPGPEGRFPVTAYIIDSGINSNHRQFTKTQTSSTYTTRVTGGYSAFTDSEFDDKYGTNDCRGHGTHVAGIVGGIVYGVNKYVTLVPVRVMNCNNYRWIADDGTRSSVSAGVDWVTENHAAGQPAVANMSIGISTSARDSTPVEEAVENLIADGVTVVASAGNENQNACNQVPARIPAVITVGATDVTDARWVANSSLGSNFGTCVDIFAPGENIKSADIASNVAAVTKTGTSMAAPFVTGVAALYLSANPTATPAEVKEVILAYATCNRITNAGSGSPNRLLYHGDDPPDQLCVSG
jgi:subtilisin family serine protease